MIKIFLGTEPRMWLGEAVFRYSVWKHNQEAEIISMTPSSEDPIWQNWDKGRPDYVPATRGENSQGKKIWFTDFTNFRWAIPEVCGFKGRAIYNDVDQIYLHDVDELWNWDMDGSPILSLMTYETSVMLIDCEKFADLSWWPSISEMKINGWGISQYTELLRDHNFFGSLPTRWNCLDGRNYQKEYTRLIHYTDMSGQVWRPYPDRLNYHRHPVREMEDLWMNLYSQALENGWIPDPSSLSNLSGEANPEVLAAFQKFLQVYATERRGLTTIPVSDTMPVRYTN